MKGVIGMNEFKHYKKSVWVQTLTDTNWVHELKKSGLEYTALPDLEHEVDYRQQSRGYNPMKLPTKARLLYDEADHIAYELEKEDPDFAKNFWHRPTGYVDPKRFKTALTLLGTSIEELREMEHSDTPEIDELELD